jgi:NAD(P)-dependent dehydrogenase (short-subunit alcohol dehydrogenase family)
VIPSALTSLNGKVAVITGGAGVIGEALAEYLLTWGVREKPYPGG